MTLKFLNKYSDAGLLLLRLGIGGMFLYHGFPKLIGGLDTWERLGGAMKYIGVDFMPVLWGFAAALTEIVGGICLILGLFFRPVCILLAGTMAVAAVMHIGKGDGLKVASHAIEDGILFLSLILIGPGKYSAGKR
jgi:putative oxidoreductase